MSNIGNKETMAKNLSYYVERSGKTKKEIAETIGVAASTFNEWTKGNKYPRIDKIEMLANYFGILKSDLIEEKSIKEMIEAEPVKTANRMADSLLRLGIELKEEEIDLSDLGFVKMIDEYKQLDAAKQEQVREYVHFLLERS